MIKFLFNISKARFEQTKMVKWCLVVHKSQLML